MWTLLLSHALAAEAPLPSASIDWDKAAFALRITAPPGEHISAEAPVRLDLSVGSSAWLIESDGAALIDGRMIFRAPGAESPIEGTARLSLCTDSGDICRPVDLRFAGEFPGARKGVGHTLRVEAPAPPAAEPNRVTRSIDEAFALARAENKLVLYDFTAVWCPPCQQLRADVLHDPTNEADLAPYVIVEVDVDRPESWALKTRYAVGGYPTLVVVNPQGDELDRSVGYATEPEFLRWIGDVAQTRRPPPPADQASPALAAELALRFAKSQREEAARAYLARAAAEPALAESWAFRAARFLLDHDPKDARWLADKAPPEVLYDWVFEAIEAAQADPALAAAIRRAVQGAIGPAPTAKAADYLQVMAALAPPTEVRAWAAAAAKVMASTLTGEPALDRGKYTPLAELLAQAGDPDGAIALLQKAVAAYPDEFSYHHALAGQLRTLGRLEEAAVEAEAAVRTGYGDNRLRAIERQARIQHARGATAEALALLDATLGAAPRPGEGLAVRTTRIIGQLEAARAELAAPPPKAP